MNGVDLSLLPPPKVIEALSYEAILAERKAYYISLHPPEQQAGIAALLELESEPIVKLLEENAYRETLLRARYNDEARALLLAFATGADLDHIGATYYDEARLLITPEDLDATPPVAAVWESDDDYRYRLSLKPESYSVAGPRDAFEFHALSADGQVKSAKPSTPHGGTTEVFILSRTGNGVPDQALIDTVETALNDETIRPLSEEVLVSPATVIQYTLEIALTLFPGASGEVALAEANARLAAFAAAHHRLNADVIKSAIDAAAHVAGVKKVVIVSPAADIDCGLGQAPYCTGITVTIAGVEA
ncbi:MAG: baseplate J/gp47 family protein [Rhodocyclaceae bacterium]|jgi:phage-related baseplate assembly protein|nr:baseplate J/gp47 family protein [Rhodocyclaceae bacterium]